jgi:ABC-2 type transport system ATP-binding protein
MSESHPVVRARGLVKRFDGVAALDGLELSVAAGEVVCLLGANGAGKTTTLHLLLGFLRADAGEAWVCGVDVAKDPRAARLQAGYLPEVVELYPLLTGRETLHYFEELAGRRLARGAATAAIERVGLRGEAIEKRVGTYSKGMRQKLGLAIALAKGARVLFLDEPMSGLDPGSANELVGLLQGLAEEGVAILMVTHDILRAHQVAHRIGIVRRGKLVEEVRSSDMAPPQIEQLYVHHLRDLA